MDSVNKYYDVEKIVAKKKLGRKVYYLVKWQNYPIEDCTWEPFSNLQNVKYMVESFNEDYPGSVDEKMFNMFEQKISSIKKKSKSNKKFLNKNIHKKKRDLIFGEKDEDSLDLFKKHLYIGIFPKNEAKIKNKDFLKESFNKETSDALSTTKDEIHPENELNNEEGENSFYFKYESNLIKPPFCVTK